MVVVLSDQEDRADAEHTSKARPRPEQRPRSSGWWFSPRSGRAQVGLDTVLALVANPLHPRRQPARGNRPTGGPSPTGRWLRSVPVAQSRRGPRPGRRRKAILGWDVPESSASRRDAAVRAPAPASSACSPTEGAWAQLAAVPTDRLASCPTGLTEDASTLPVAGLTAFACSRSPARCSAGGCSSPARPAGRPLRDPARAPRGRARHRRRPGAPRRGERACASWPPTS